LCTKLCRISYHLSWKECLLATWGGFKGSLCLILAMALASEFQLIDKLLIPPNSLKFKVKNTKQILDLSSKKKPNFSSIKS